MRYLGFGIIGNRVPCFHRLESCKLTLFCLSAFCDRSKYSQSSYHFQLPYSLDVGDGSNARVTQ
jgi:hypothetical protein